MYEEHLKLIEIDFIDTLSTEQGENQGTAWKCLSKEGRGSELGCAFYSIFHKDGVSDVKCGQNLYAHLMLIQGDKGVDIDIREESGCKMRDSPEKNCEKGRMLRCILWVAHTQSAMKPMKQAKSRVVASPALSILGWTLLRPRAYWAVA